MKIALIAHVLFRILEGMLADAMGKSTRKLTCFEVPACGIFI